MLRATLRSLAARKLRLALSATAIVLGVAFVVGSFVFTDTMDKTFRDIFGQVNPAVTVRPQAPSGTDSFEFSGTDARTVPASLVDEIAALDDVDRADGNVESQSVFVVGADGELVGGNGPPGIAVNWNDAPSASGDDVVEIVDGRPPERAGEIVLDERTVEKSGYAVGDTVPLVTSSDTLTLTAELVGIAHFGEGGALGGATLTILETAAAQGLLLGTTDAFTSIAVTGREGVSDDELRREVEAVVPAGLEARTADEMAKESTDELQEALGFFNTFLLVFAAVALFVGVFLILNTFSILIAQRTQEMALYRALGASRRQVTRSVMVEAVVVGLVGSTIGLLFGLAVAQLLKVAFAAFGLDLGGSGLVLQLRTVVLAYLVGVIVTAVAAYVPARRAARVAPVAAMRDDVVLPQSSRNVHLTLGIALSAAGAALMTVGLVADVAQAALLVGLGILTVFVGVALLAPIISNPIVRAVSLSYPRLFGATGRLARENALRNPRRTAATASALMIGLALVAAIAVLGQSTNESIDRALDDGLQADFVISNVVGQPFSAQVGDQVAELDGVAEVAAVRMQPAQIDGDQVLVTALDPAAFSAATEFEVTDGSADIGTDGVLIAEPAAESRGLDVGDLVTVTLPATEQQFHVAGIFPRPLLTSEVILGLDALEAGGVRPEDSFVYVVSEPGASAADVRAGIDRVTANVPTVTVKDQVAFKDEQRSSVNQLLAIVYALLGLAVLIAILGIVNTLALSVLERTREIGLLRAVGLSRRQLRTMVRLESIAIAILGAVLGVVLGVIFGVALQRAVAAEGLEVLAVPWFQLAVFLAMAAVIGILAAVWPARRAAKLNVMRAITTE